MYVNDDTPSREEVEKLRLELSILQKKFNILKNAMELIAISPNPPNVTVEGERRADLMFANLALQMVNGPEEVRE